MTSVAARLTRRSVRRSVILGTLLSVAVAVLLLAWRDYRFATRLLTAQASASMSASVSSAAARLEALVGARLDAVRTAAQNPLLIEFAEGSQPSKAGALYALNALVRVDPIHNTLAGLVASDRRLLLATSEEVGETTTGPVRDLPFPSVVSFGTSDGSAANTTFLASVRSRTGQQLAVLGLRTRPTAFTQILSEIGTVAPSAGLLRVRKVTGDVVGAWPLPRRDGVQPARQSWDSLPANVELLSEATLAGGVRERRYRLRTHGNVIRETALRLTTVPWYVAMTTDEDVVLEPARREARSTLLFAGAVLLSVAMLSAVVGGRFAKRIEDMAVVVRRIARGDHGARVPLDGTDDEITQLGRDVNRMTDELAGTLSSLEERTQQLESELDERAILEARLVESRRMEAIGMVAGTVAHDFNNVLTIMLSAAETAREALPEHHQALADIEEIAMAAERGVDLTRRLLSIARQSDARPSRMDAAVLVRENGRLLRRLVPEGTLDVVTVDARAWVYIDPTELLQALLNLVANARDASGGNVPHVTVQVERVSRSPEGLLSGAKLGDGEYVAISVRDRGTGMSPDTVARLCEPFFTTKPRGKGTGLGLASVAKAMHEAEGALAVASALGEGSTFTLVLPYAGSRNDHVSANAGSSSAAPSGR